MFVLLFEMFIFKEWVEICNPSFTFFNMRLVLNKLPKYISEHHSSAETIAFLGCKIYNIYYKPERLVFHNLSYYAKQIKRMDRTQ